MNASDSIRRAALLLALGLPAAAVAQTGTGQIADGTWTLSQLSDREGTLRFAGPDAPTLRLLGTGVSTAEGTQVSGNTGCNTFKTTAVFTSRTLRLRPIASTLRACEPAWMQAEARYLKLLKDASRFIRHEQALIITAPQGRAVFMFGTYAQEQLRSTWRLVGSQGDTPLTVAFEQGGQVLGTGGCNTFMGRYQTDENTLSVGSLASTRRACADAASQRQETTYLNDLQQVRSLQVAGGTLTLSTESGKTLQFVRPVN